MLTVAQRDCGKQSEAIECHEFTLILSGFEEITDDVENKLFEAGCDDALLGLHGGTPYLSFDRVALTLASAIKSAIRAVESCGFEVVRVIPPGADTIEIVNAYLKTRRQLHQRAAQSLSPELVHKIDDLLDAFIKNDDLNSIRTMFDLD